MNAKKCVPLGKEDADQRFERVWQRVMPDGNNSPIVVTPVGSRPSGCAACQKVEKLSQALSQGQEQKPAGQAEVSPVPKPAAQGDQTSGQAQKAAPAPAASTKESPQWEDCICPPRTRFRALRDDETFEAPARRQCTKPEPPAVEGVTQQESRLPTLDAAVPLLTNALSLPEWDGDNQGGSATLSEEAPPEVDVLPRPEETSVHFFDDFPPQSAVPWLGSLVSSYGPLLQEMIRKELTDWHYYRSLGRKAGGAASRVFANLAADEMTCAKRLSASYFLSCGIRYWPEKTDKISIPSYLGALRERFHNEQQDAEVYSAAILGCEDECLCELFSEIAQQNRRHAQQLRQMVEQL